jgi:hypothetical protein
MRHGVSNKLLSFLKALHRSVKVRFGVDEIEQVFESMIGVKQSRDRFGTGSFHFSMASVMDS